VAPETAPTAGLKPNHYALINGDWTFDTLAGSSAITVQQTAGCSCEQIIVKMGLGSGHRKNGCSQEVMNRWMLFVTQ